MRRVQKESEDLAAGRGRGEASGVELEDASDVREELAAVEEREGATGEGEGSIVGGSILNISLCRGMLVCTRLSMYA
jgi:hypothetical protein